MNTQNSIGATLPMVSRYVLKPKLQDSWGPTIPTIAKNERNGTDGTLLNREVINIIQSNQRHLNYSVDQQSGVLVLTIKDKDENLIRQVPMEESLVLARIYGRNKGLIVDQKI